MDINLVIVITKFSLILLGVFIFAESLVGYLKVKNMAAFNNPGFMGGVFLVACGFTLTKIYPDPQIADLALSGLNLVYCIRLTKTKRFMPWGMLLLLCLIELAFLFYGHFRVTHQFCR